MLPNKRLVVIGGVAAGLSAASRVKRQRPDFEVIVFGAHAVGGEGVAKRIDIFATAILTEMTLDEIAWLDLTYVPHVAPVWDPVLLAAQAGMKKV